MKNLLNTLIILAASVTISNAQINTDAGTAVIAKVSNMTDTIFNDTAMVAFNIYIDASRDDINYPTVRVIDKKTKKTIYNTHMTYYVHMDSEAPYHIILPKNIIKKKKKYEIYFVPGDPIDLTEDSILMSNTAIVLLYKKSF